MVFSKVGISESTVVISRRVFEVQFYKIRFQFYKLRFPFYDPL